MEVEKSGTYQASGRGRAFGRVKKEPWILLSVCLALSRLCILLLHKPRNKSKTQTFPNLQTYTQTFQKFTNINPKHSKIYKHKPQTLQNLQIYPHSLLPSFIQFLCWTISHNYLLFELSTSFSICTSLNPKQFGFKLSKFNILEPNQTVANG